ncbi:MAG: right-handed parallel beta-helix repeat-containing protein [Ignavibacteriaceae bacterium]
MNNRNHHKGFLHFLVMSIALLLLCLPSNPLFAQLSGNYTIGNGGDYTNFTDAVSALQTQGISADVTFNVISGTYNEQIVMQYFTGMTFYRVTFKSQEGVADSVTLWFESQTYDFNYVVKLDGVRNITFQNLTFHGTGATYSRIFEMESPTYNTGSIKFINNVFKGIYDTGSDHHHAIIYSDEVDIDSIEVTGNQFLNGSYGVFLEGTNTYEIPGIEVVNNTFSNIGYTGVYLHWVHAPIVVENIIQADFYGIRIPEAFSSMQIRKNKIIASNQGISVNCEGGSSNHGIISNNFVSLGSAGDHGINILNSEYVDVYYNSVFNRGIDRQSKAFNAISGGMNNVLNNNFANMNTGYAYYVFTASAISISDNNNFYTPGNYIAYRDSNIVDLAELQFVSGKNLNSLAVYPHYLSESDLHTIAPWLDEKAQPIAEILDDIDGDPRNLTSPDIGADEFSPDPSTKIPLSGTLTIGFGGDYETFNEASDDVVLKGISDDLDFDVLPGVYNEQIDLVSIPGASLMYEVGFQSQTGNAADVTITYTANTLDSNYVIRLYGSDYVHFYDLTFTATGDPFARVIDLYEGTEFFTLRDCILNSIPESGNDQRQAIVYSGDSYYRSRNLDGNIFNRGTFAVYMRRENLADEYPLDLEIRDNIINENGYTGIYLQYHQAPAFYGNNISASTYGIQVINCDNALSIRRNKINVGNTNGIYLSNCQSTEFDPGWIVNNFVYVGGSGQSAGIRLQNCDYQYLYYNNVHTSSANTGSRALYISSGSNIKLTNNIFMNSGSGYSYYIFTPTAISSSDYNDLFTNGTNLAYWNGPLATLADLQTASGMDLHSVSVDPEFASNTDLHVNAKDLDSSAIPILWINNDIDNDTRDENFPDIGADEFIYGLNYPPVIISEPDTLAYVDSLYQYQVVATDNNGDTLYYNLTISPSWLSIDHSTGMIEGTPTTDNVGDTTVTLSVDDGHGGLDEQTYTLHIDFPDDINIIDNHIPKTYALLQNYPNPFNPSTTIRFELPISGLVTLKIYDVLGNEIVTLVNEELTAGKHEVEFYASPGSSFRLARNLASGIYFYTLRAGDFIQTKKMILIK